MGMIEKEVTGITENLKLVSNGKQAPTTPIGGTSRDKFTGSNDTRPAGKAAPNKTLKDAPGLIDQAPVYRGDTSFGDKWVKAGDRGAIVGQVTVAREDVTTGMGGTFYKDSQ